MEQPVRSSQLDILDLTKDSHGWQPIKHLIALMSDIFDARVITSDRQIVPTLTARCSYRFLPRKRIEGAPSLLVMAAKAEGIKSFRKLPGWRNSYGTVAAWIIDSFHSDGLSPAHGFRHFDKIFVTWGGNIPEYQAMTSSPVTWLPWGTDALRLGHMSTKRQWDLVRLGRQPQDWDNDQDVTESLAAHGLSYHGRPPRTPAEENGYAALLSQYLSHAKFVLAHSNLADGSGYTHSSREYMTARWTDSFACGAAVMGVQPRTDPLFNQILPEGVVDLETIDRSAAMARIRSEIAAWTPERASIIRKMALQQFDWRWRLKDLAREMKLGTEKLDAELAEIDAMVRREAQPLASAPK